MDNGESLQKAVLKVHGNHYLDDTWTYMQSLRKKIWTRYPAIVRAHYPSTLALQPDQMQRVNATFQEKKLIATCQYHGHDFAMTSNHWPVKTC
jgi:hypothetical protein